MGRINFAAKNVGFGLLGNIITSLLGFIVRAILINRIGDTLTGVNDLYTSILSVLSLAELGVGTALNFSLYGPVARQDTEKIKSYMQLYRKAYQTIGIVVAVIGIGISPFLQYLVQKPENVTIRDLTLYYFIFLFNTVTSYFVAYKYSLVNAQQKNYIQTNITTITKMVTVSLQIVMIIVTESFYVYLLTSAVIELLQKIIVNGYLNKLYPYLKDRNVEKLSKEETTDIVNKTKALMLHKIGDVARLQTDAMIISSFCGVIVTAFVGNYNMVLSTVSNYVNIVLNSVLSSFGNLIATESKEKQFKLFRVYRFFACWIYGFSAVGFYLLITPLIILWVGEERVLAPMIVTCILIDYYFKGDRIVLSNFKTAAGVFEQDKYLALIQGAVNLVISIILVQKIGLIGVYIGTIVSGLIANITKPYIIYKIYFGKNVLAYFADSVKYIIVTLIGFVPCLLLKLSILKEGNILTFILVFLITCIIFNIIFLLFYRKSEEFNYIWGFIINKRRKKTKGANDETVSKSSRL